MQEKMLRPESYEIDWPDGLSKTSTAKLFRVIKGIIDCNDYRK